MKITLITSEALSDFPPMITLLSRLDTLGHSVCIITPYGDNVSLQGGWQNMQFLYVKEQRKKWLTQYYAKHLLDSVAFHTDRLLKRIYVRKIPDMFASQIKDADVVWVLHENTALLGGKRFLDHLNKSYLYTMYELCIKNGKINPIYEYAASHALLMVSPEYCRAHIMKAIYALDTLPVLIPNKPAIHPRTKNLPISDKAIADKIYELEQSQKKIILYMGILSKERPLEPIMNAISQSDKYVLAVLGARSPYLDTLERDCSGQFVYLGFVQPPNHLEIASHADVAYISYIPQKKSINAVFCAPNKVYEFAGFGIPMLCNDVPGLKYVVENAGMGICVSDMKASTFLGALDEISAHNEQMSAAAHRYYDSENLDNSIEQALEKYLRLKKEGDL